MAICYRGIKILASCKCQGHVFWLYAPYIGSIFTIFTRFICYAKWLKRASAVKDPHWLV